MLAALPLFPLEVFAAPAYEGLVELKQPSGKVFKARQKGDEWNNHVETEDGYGVYKNALTGDWQYSMPSPDGKTNGLKAVRSLSNAVVGEVDPASIGIPKGLRPQRKTPAEMPRLNASSGPAVQNDSQEALLAGGIAESAPVSGTKYLLAIGVDYSNSPSTYSPEQVQQLLFGTNGSVKDYYNKTSYSAVTVTPAAESNGTANDGFIGWLRLSGSHPNTGSSTGTSNQQIAKAAILAANPYIDYSLYDSNANGIIEPAELSIIIIVAGYERSYSASYSPSVWGHSWSMYSVGYPLVDGKTIREYAQFGEKHGDHLATMGIMAHEIGHLMFSLPDLYDTDTSNGDSAGIGYFDIMAGGSWGAASGAYAGSSPTFLSAWSREYLSWGTVTAISSSQAVSFPKTEGNSASVFRLNTPDPDQYFLIENRQFSGYDTGFHRGTGASGHGGIVVYHIDKLKTNRWPANNDVNADETDKGVDVEEANEGNLGYSMLDTGTAMANTNMFYFSGNNTSFSDSGNPNSKLKNSTSTEISITSISVYSDSMTATVTLSDSVAPTGSVSINSDNIYTNNTSVTLTLSCIDTGGGCLEMQFSSDNAVWSAPEVYAEAKTWILDDGDGAKTVYVKYRDTAGNWSGVYSDTIVLDTTPPVVSIITVITPTDVTTQTIAGTVEDGATVYVETDTDASDGDAAVNGTTWSYEITGLAAGVNNVIVAATDAAGNSTIETSRIVLDTIQFQYTLTISKTGRGNGAVISTPPGIDCGVDCSESYTTFTDADLIAIPDSSSIFAGWSGDCTGTDQSVSLVMDTDKACSANFMLGIRSEYYDNGNLTGPALVRVDPLIDFNWDTGSPDPALDADTFSARWSGKLQADYDETYTFSAISDDGIRLWIDGHLVLDYWKSGGVSISDTVDLTSGLHDFKMEYLEDSGTAMIQLYWSSPSTAYEIIPNDHLYPPDGYGSAPVLNWAGDYGYSADGLNPHDGDEVTLFTYRVRYTDADGDAPMNGYPAVHILENGMEISGSPFVMDYESGDFSDGAIYRFTATLPLGADYTYYFDAKDDKGLQAVAEPSVPTPVAPLDAPDVCSSQGTYYRDSDGDGYGDPEVYLTVCTQPSGYVSNSDDCSDSNALVKPGSEEVCNGIDDNCNDLVDEDIAFSTYYQDADGDTYGNDSIAIEACSQPAGYSSNSTDCNDSNASIRPGIAEVCNGIDDNCNGQVDEGLVFSTYYRDADGDAYGNAFASTYSCTRPYGYVSNNSDCNDNKASIRPGAVEEYNGTDDNCNGQIDEGLSVKKTVPEITVTPVTIAFGSVNVDSSSDRSVYIRSDGDASLIIGNITGASGSFSKVSDNCSGQTLSPSSGCTITVRFLPVSAGAFNGSIDIPSNDPDESRVTLSITGTGAAVGSPDIDILPSRGISFPNIMAGATADQEITISNNGNIPLTILSSTAPTEPFSIVAGEDNCSNQTLAPNQSCIMKIRFTPAGSGIFNSDFDIRSNDPDENRVTVNVSGSATPNNNNPPTKPELAYPTNGATGVMTTVTFEWDRSGDPDGDPVSFKLYLDTDPAFAGTSPRIIASSLDGNSASMAMGYPIGIMGLFGVMAIGWMPGNRKRMSHLLIAVITVTGLIFTSCGDGKVVENNNSGNKVYNESYSIDKLLPDTTYYWKVVADDGKGGMTESDTYTFTTGH